jgi:hypothetical protein
MVCPSSLRRLLKTAEPEVWDTAKEWFERGYPASVFAAGLPTPDALLVARHFAAGLAKQPRVGERERALLRLMCVDLARRRVTRRQLQDAGLADWMDSQIAAAAGATGSKRAMGAE